MKVEQLYTKCLAQGAYYIESNGEAAVIDPLRDFQTYLDLAAENQAQIKFVFETHFHADFVSGHIDLAKATGANIVFGPNAKTPYPATIAKDLQTFQIGDFTLQVLHTPGHTLESSCYLLQDENGKEKALFTGDTVFIGDVGRPDLAQQESAGITQEHLAGMLYDSIREKILPLPDDIIIYPAHGAGSACGKNMSKETFDTLGNQKQTNYALAADLSREDFIHALVDGLASPPYYFPENVALNQKGYDALPVVLERSLIPLSAENVQEQIEQGAMVLDTRAPKAFTQVHIPGSVFVGIDGGFAPWVGTVITDIQQKIVVVADPGREEEVVTRLARVGYHGVVGFLENGFDAWLEKGFPTRKIEDVSAAEFVEEKEKLGSAIIDVRKPSEFENGHVAAAQLHPLAAFYKTQSPVQKDKKNFIYCGGGYRSVIYASLLLKDGNVPLTNVLGGYAAIAPLL